MNKRFPILLAALLCAVLLCSAALAAGPEDYKIDITKVSVGAPITGVDGKKYIPVDVHFTSEKDPEDSKTTFLEGIVRALHDGGQSDVAYVGMTLMKVKGTPTENNQFNWNKNTKKGVIKYNVPVLDSGEEQTVEHSGATGLNEVNGVKENNTIQFSVETVVMGERTTSFVPSNELSVVYKPSELPAEYTKKNGEEGCDHKGTDRYTKSVDDWYHGVYCAKCNKLVMRTSHTIETAPNTEAPNFNQYGSLDGMQYVKYCEECDYKEMVTCTHLGTITYEVADDYHVEKCTKCKGVGNKTPHAYGDFEGVNPKQHTKTCVCGHEITEKHKLDKRTFYKYKYDRVWNTYYVFFTQKCSVCETELNGYVAYGTGLTDYWVDYTQMLDKLIESGRFSDEWMTHQPGTLDHLKAGLMATGLGKVADWLGHETSTKYATFMLDCNRLSNGQYMDVRAFRKDGTEITKGKTQAKGLQARAKDAHPIGGEDILTDLTEDDVTLFDLSNESEVAFVFDGATLSALEDGPHTITILVEGGDEDGDPLFDADGNCAGLAIEMTFTVSTVLDGEGNPIKCVSPLTPRLACSHPDARQLFNVEGHWWYCPDCQMSLENSYEEHSLNHQQEIKEVTVLGAADTGVALGIGNTVKFVGASKTFTYLPVASKDAWSICVQDDDSTSQFVPGGFGASPDDPLPQPIEKYAVMVANSELDMIAEYGDCGFGLVHMLKAHLENGVAAAEPWFSEPGKTVSFFAHANPGYQVTSIRALAGDREVPLTMSGENRTECTFTMPAEGVVFEVVFDELPSLHLPAETLTVEESAFEATAAYVVYVNEGCETIGPNAFKDCPNLQVAHIPWTVQEIDDTAFDGCKYVYVYGSKYSQAYYFCKSHSNTYFLEEGSEW